MRGLARSLVLSALLACVGVGVPVTAHGDSGGIDLVLCIDVGGDARYSLETVKRSASRFLDDAFSGNPVLRVAIVAYSSADDAPSLKVLPFTANKAAARGAITNLTIAGEGTGGGPVFGALLAVLKGGVIGDWRATATKIVLLIGRTPPSTAGATSDDVVRAVTEMGSARIYSVLVDGLSQTATAAFSDLARRSGGLAVAARAWSEATGRMLGLMNSAPLGGSADTDPRGRVVQLIGGDLDVEFDAPVTDIHPGMRVLVFSATTPGLLIAEGPIMTGEGLRYGVETQASYSLESIRVGCVVNIVR